MIRLSTIGPLSVQVGRKPVPASNAQVTAALLLLAVERGKPVSRRLLAEMFFSDRDPDGAAHSCRQLVYRLRTKGAALDGDAASVTL
jgi:DNA-binding SARP family transcriptional activator